MRLLVIGDHQCGLERSGAIFHKIICIRQILEKKFKYNGTVHVLFIDFSKACD
jgi:hypothetical protein